MKNILVTGGAGYIGAHIIEILIKKKLNIFIVDNLTTGHKQLINKKAKFFKLDILKTNELKKIITTHNIDSIIHLAANLIISEGEKSPKKYFNNNVIGTQSILEASEGTRVKNFLFSSTAAVYKDGIYRVTESSQIKPKSIYGKTKVKAEKLIKTNCKKLKINYAILRYFNIAGASPSGKIGLLNKSDNLFKNYSNEIIKKNPVLKIYGTDYKTKDGSCIRDFIHVSDIADIHSKILYKIDKLNVSKILNCGYDKGVSVLEVAREFKRQSSKNVTILKANRRKKDIVKIIASNSKLKNFITWTPKFNSLNKIVKSCLNWEKKQK
jgi:UDP-glucose 4-epimerase